MRTAPEVLTSKRLEAFKIPAGKPFADLRDAHTPGLLYRVRANGWRGFYFRYTAPGGRDRPMMALGRYGDRPPALSLAQARIRAGRLRLLLEDGTDPKKARDTAARAERAEREAARAAKKAERERERALAAGKPLPGTFAHLASCYIRDHAKKRKRTWREDERKLKRDLLPVWGRRDAGSITRGDVHSLVFGIAEGEGHRARPGKRAPYTANRTLALISRIFAYAVEVEYHGVTVAVGAEYRGITVNPAYRLKRPILERPRNRALSEAEVWALWKATEEELPIPRAAVRLLLLTGLRRGELLGARWRDVQADRIGRWLEVPGERTKGGRPLRAPLSSLAWKTLAELGEARDPAAIFPGARAGRSLYDLKGPMKRLRVRVKALAGDGADPDAAPWRLHDLRRTFRSLLSSLGVDFRIAERCLGHVTPDARGVAAHYDVHQYSEERMRAVEMLAHRVKAIVSKKEPAAADPLPFTPNRRRNRAAR